MAEVSFEDKLKDFAEKLGGLNRDIEADLERLRGLDIPIPTWDEARDQKVLFTCLYQVTSEADRLSKRLALVFQSRAAFYRIRSGVHGDFARRLAIFTKIEKTLAIVTENEKALNCHRDILDKKFKALQSAQFLQNSERYIKI